MNPTLTFLITSLVMVVIVGYKDTGEDDSSERSKQSKYLDMRGTLRKYFSLEAALLNTQTNMACSPISALFPLGKLLLGAKGSTSKELMSVIGCKKKSKIEKFLKRLIRTLKYLPGVSLSVVSRLYISGNVALKPDFEAAARNIFKSSVEKLGSTPKSAANRINSWVSEQTNGMIPNLVSPTDLANVIGSPSLLMINAVYFAGEWQDPFERLYTGSFFSSLGEQRVPMMSRQGSYNYWKSDTISAEVIEIPYKGGEASFVIFLPYTRTGLPELLEKLKEDPTLMEKVLRRMKSAKVTVHMPKFKVEATADLKLLYERIGMRRIFDRQMSGLTEIFENQSSYVSKAIQKVVIQVDEQGTKAAAASVMDLIPVSLILDQIEFRANRPFLYFVKAETQQLFAGTLKAI